MALVVEEVDYFVGEHFVGEAEVLRERVEHT
jgi:hypothetical protein